MGIGKSAARLSVLWLVLSAVPISVPPACAAGGGTVEEAYELLKASHYERALPALSRLVEQEPENTQARRYLAYALLRTGRPVKSAAQILKLRGPACSFDYYVLGEAYRSVNRPLEAERCFQLVLSREPGYEAARAGLINVYDQTGDSLRAMEQCILGRQLTSRESSIRFFSHRWATVRRGHSATPALTAGPPAREREEEPIVEITNNEAADLGIAGSGSGSRFNSPVQPFSLKRRSGAPPPPPKAPRSGPYSGSG
ncbi:MAG: tetratricopeptide repeat protein [Candidatus Melainabacteria bacterium]|nr:tetratricopeptide repeat protein [Candidatus Melainabacteria bacterium]